MADDRDLGGRLERLSARWGVASDEDVRAAEAAAWSEVLAGDHLPSAAPARAASAGGPGRGWRERRVPVPEAVLALGWSHVWAWVCFAALTWRRGSSVSAAEVAAAAGWSPGHARRLLAAVEAVGGLVGRRGRRWVPLVMMRDITGWTDGDGLRRAPGHGRFQFHSVAELGCLDAAGRRAAILLGGLRLWSRLGRRPVARRTLARWYGRSRRTIDRLLRVLRASGAVAVVGTPRGLVVEAAAPT